MFWVLGRAALAVAVAGSSARHGDEHCRCLGGLGRACPAALSACSSLPLLASPQLRLAPPDRHCLSYLPLCSVRNLAALPRCRTSRGREAATTSALGGGPRQACGSPAPLQHGSPHRPRVARLFRGPSLLLAAAPGVRGHPGDVAPTAALVEGPSLSPWVVPCPLSSRSSRAMARGSPTPLLSGLQEEPRLPLDRFVSLNLAADLVLQLLPGTGVLRHRWGAGRARRCPASPAPPLCVRPRAGHLHPLQGPQPRPVPLASAAPLRLAPPDPRCALHAGSGDTLPAVAPAQPQPAPVRGVAAGAQRPLGRQGAELNLKRTRPALAPHPATSRGCRFQPASRLRAAAGRGGEASARRPHRRLLCRAASGDPLSAYGGHCLPQPGLHPGVRVRAACHWAEAAGVLSDAGADPRSSPSPVSWCCLWWKWTSLNSQPSPWTCWLLRTWKPPHTS